MCSPLFRFCGRSVASEVGLAVRVTDNRIRMPWHEVLCEVVHEAVSVTLPVVTLASLLHGQRLWPVVYSYSLKPLVLLWWVFAVLIVHDTYFFWMHRLAHRCRWLYRVLHAAHHNTGAMCEARTTLLSTGAEVVIMLAVPQLLCIAVYMSLFAWHHSAYHVNVWHVYMPLVTLGQIGMLQHSGLKFNNALALLINPMLLATHLCGTAYMYHEHVVHHERPQYNLAPFFRHWDVWCATSAGPDPSKHASMHGPCNPICMLNSITRNAAITLAIWFLSGSAAGVA